jgi:hypothetical protein
MASLQSVASNRNSGNVACGSSRQMTSLSRNRLGVRPLSVFKLPLAPSQAELHPC